MFENEAKGWHGSYSSLGRISAEKFPMILTILLIFIVNFLIL